MKHFKTVFSFLFLATLISCGGRNEPEENKKKETNSTETFKTDQDTLNQDPKNDTIALNPIYKKENEKNNTPNSDLGNPKKTVISNVDIKKDKIIISPIAKKADAVINSPLRNLLNKAELGKSYTKSELIELYKFPKEAVELIHHITCVGQNKLYFKWGNTWIVEKVSDAKFKNDTMVIVFKQNKTYVSGGAIGIKYNKKIYTDLILNNGSAYIPTVKGYHWDIGK
jgi:hypothetical protein